MKHLIPCFYGDYGKKLNKDRQMPLYNDSLRPVERRLLLTLHEEAPNKFKKSSSVIGTLIAKYHPHGDLSAYETLQNLVIGGYATPQGQWGGRGLDGKESAAAHRYCVTGDTRICTYDNLPRIKDLSKKEDINIPIVSYDGKINFAKKFFDCGKFPIIKIETEFGYELKGSYNHPILIFNKNCQPEWKPLQNIQEGDFAILRKSENFTKLTPLNEDVCKLLGCLISEGWHSKTQNKIGFSNTDWDYIIEFEDSLNNLGIYYKKYDVTLKSGKLLRSIEILRKSEIKKIINLGFSINDSYGHQIPEVIWGESKKGQEIFLKYLFTGDGSVSLGSRNRLEISYTSVSSNLRKDVQKLLLMRFGILSRQAPKENKLIIQGIVNCKKFLNLIGFFGKKQKKLEKYLQQLSNIKTRAKTDFIPYLRNYILKKYKIPYGYKGIFERNTWTTYQTLPKYINVLYSFIDDKDKKLLNFLLNQNYTFVKIKEKEKLPEDNIYSIRIDSKCHSFLSDGFISHNTEIKAAKWVEELAFKYVDYVPWDNIEFSNEPLVLPSPVPIGLVGYSNLVGITFDTTKIPKYKLADLAKRLSWLLKQEDKEPIIIPNFRDCISKEISSGEYKKILNEGSGTLKVVPNGRIIDNTIHIEGVIPGRTFKSLRYHSDSSNKNRKLNVRLIDDSGSEEDPFSIDILVEPIKKSMDLKELFKTIWKEYLISNVEYKCVFTDYEGKLHKLGIDDILINNYRIWVESVLRERAHVYNKLNNQKYYLTIVSIIKETLDKSNKKIKKVDDLILEYRNIYNTIPKIKLKQFDIETRTFEDLEYELSEEEIKKTCRNHSITKLIEIDTDFQDLENQILNQKTKITDTEKDCFDYVNDLGQEKINF